MTPYERINKAMDDADVHERNHIRIDRHALFCIQEIAEKAQRITRNYKNYTRPLTDPEKDLRCAVDAFFGEKP